MPDDPKIGGEKFKALFLGLNEEEFVEWVFVGDRNFEFARGVSHGHRQEDHTLFL